MSNALLEAHLRRIEANSETMVKRAEKLKGLRELLRSNELRAFLLYSAEERHVPFLTVTNVGATPDIYNSYEGGQFNPAMVFFFSRQTGHAHVLIPQPHDGIVHLQNTPDPTQSKHGLVTIRKLISGYWYQVQESGFRLYDDEELIPPKETVLTRIMGPDKTHTELLRASDQSMAPYDMIDNDPRPVLQRFTDVTGSHYFSNLAAKGIIPLLDPFDMQIVTNGVAQAIDSGK